LSGFLGQLAHPALFLYFFFGYLCFIMIQATGIEKSFGELKVLKGIDFTAEDREVISIVGASGAGKSTLLQILGSLYVPDAGKVFIDGQDIFSLSEKELADFRNRKIGFVFQFHHLLPEFTAKENVMIPAMIAGRRDPEQAAALLEELGLGERLDHKPSQLSGGEQQRVAVARALVNSPSVIFADEPSGNLDSKTREELHNLFFKIRDTHGVTFVIVTHDRDLARLSDRCLEMRDGRFV
jgi:lipoprotein-releasing system ATP-binding protein